jgi:hypothetical protein
MGRASLFLGLFLLISSAALADAPATGEPPITATGKEGEFLRSMHGQIHFRWTRFIEEAAKKSPKDPVNNPKLEAEVLFTVRWDGSPAQFTISRTSGVPAFDEAAITAVKGDNARYPVPPIDIYGDDGVAHMRWVFARDHRLCGVGEVRRFEAPLREALPRLFVQGRVKEGLLRSVRYQEKGDQTAVSEFARAYLARPFPDPTLDIRAGAALAQTGDSRQVARIKPGLARAETIPVVAPALAASKADVCQLVLPKLTPKNPEIPLATLALRSAGVELPANSPCVEAMAAIQKDDTVPAADRAEMLESLAAVSPGSVRKQALSALGDADPKMRAAGAKAFARPGGGRPTLYRLQPLLADTSADVRAAAGAGMVRACGDLANDYIMPLFRARDVQPLVAIAPELGKASSPASADLLAKLQKRPEPELKLPVLAALANRQDPAGRALYQPLAQAVKKDPYASPEARRIVYASADPDELRALATRDAAMGIVAYKALLRAHRHQEALDWVVGAFDRSPPETLVAAFGAWLAMPPAAAPAATPPPAATPAK